MKPFSYREIINMTIRADNNETFRNQFPSVSERRITPSSVRPWIALTFRLLLVECSFFHCAAEWAIVPCRESYRRNFQKTVLWIGIILPIIRGPTQFLNTQPSKQTLILYYERCRIIVAPHIQTGNHQGFIVGERNDRSHTPWTNQGTSAHRSVIKCHFLALLWYIAIGKYFGLAGCIYAAHGSGSLNSPGAPCFIGMASCGIH